MYNFDNGVERKGTNCVKWDVPFITEEITPMWIADMDFQVPDGITENLVKVARQGAFGYQFLSQNYYNAIISWMERRHNYKVSRDEIVYIPNVVMGLRYAVQTISDPGDEIIIMTPVYGPFFRVVNETERVLVESQMINVDGYYTMDFEDFESKITEKTKAVIICNPHNPAGRVWKKDELQKMADICMKHNLYILSDDIHSELLAKGQEHTFIAALSEEVRAKTLTFTSPTKAFNLASIHVANGFIADKEVREKFQTFLSQSFSGECNCFAEAALVGAYDKSEDWLDALNVYIEENIDYFVNTIQKEMPKLTVCKPEGTYLVWVDFRKTGIPHKKLQEYMKNECGVFVNEGTFFGSKGEGFMRFNLACPRANIIPVLNKMKEKFA